MSTNYVTMKSSPTATDTAAETPTIYVVDDTEEVTKALHWLFDSVGYCVKSFQDPHDFLDNFSDDTPGCIVLDVRMPGLTGLELQDNLRARGHNMPIIFMTAHGDVPMAVRAMKGGAVDFHTKPVNNQVLLESVNRALRVDSERRLAEAKSIRFKELASSLTPREKEVMKLMMRGKLTKVIADDLGISPNTAELHRAKVLKKMKTRTVAELISMSQGIANVEAM